MSHFTVLKTRFVDADLLVKALADVGFSQVELHATAQPLVGYQGDLRSQRAEVIIRREFISKASNDIGFHRGEDGAFEALISEYDRATYDQDWLNRLAQRYAYHTTRQQLQAQGFALVEEETNADGQVRLVLRRFS